MNDLQIDLIPRLRSAFERFSPSDARIAQKILDAPLEISALSSQELAERCQVSQSSIIKFCQRMGYKGYPALKLALSAEIGRGTSESRIHQNIFSDDSIGAVAEKLHASKVAALADTMRVNSGADIEKAVDMIVRANRVALFGIGGSALVAKDLAWKLAKFGKPVSNEMDSHTQLANLASLTPDDLLIAISHSGRTVEVRIAVEYANSKDIPVLAITGLDAKPFNPKIGITLSCVADENLVRSSSIATRTAQMAITDLLFVSATQRLGGVVDRISESQKIVERLK